MWEKLIGLFIEWAKGRPRTQILNELLHLRNAMRSTQSAYLKFLEVQQKGEARTTVDAAFLWWCEFEKLTLVIADIDEVIGLFRPEIGGALRDYVYAERNFGLSHIKPFLLTATDVEMIEGDDKEFDDARAARNRLFRDFGDLGALKTVLDWNIRQADAGVHFDSGLEVLDSYIRTTFSIEEVQAAYKPLVAHHIGHANDQVQALKRRLVSKNWMAKK